MSNTQIQYIQKIQNCCLLFKSENLLVNKFNSHCISNRKKNSDRKFVFKLLTETLFCSEKLSFFNVFVPLLRTRSSIKNALKPYHHIPNYAPSTSINRIMPIANDEQIAFLILILIPFLFPNLCLVFHLFFYF